MDEQQLYVSDVISAVIYRAGRRWAVLEGGDHGHPVIGDFSIYI